MICRGQNNPNCRQEGEDPPEQGRHWGQSRQGKPPRPHLEKTKRPEDETILQDETLSTCLSPLDSREPAPQVDRRSPLEKPSLPVEKTSLIAALEKPSLPVVNRCLLRELCLSLPACYPLSLPACFALPLSVMLSAAPCLLRLLCYPLPLSAISLLYLQKQERPRSIQSTFSLNLQKTPNNKSGNKNPANYTNEESS